MDCIHTVGEIVRYVDTVWALYEYVTVNFCYFSNRSVRAEFLPLFLEGNYGLRIGVKGFSFVFSFLPYAYNESVNFLFIYFYLYYFFILFFYFVVNLCILVTSKSIMGIISFKLFVSLRRKLKCFFTKNVFREYLLSF